MTPIRDRPTDELVVLCLVGLLSFIVAAITVGAVVIKVWHPSADVSDIGSTLRDVIGTLIAALVGYIGGRSSTAGKSSTDTPRRKQR